MSIKRTGHLSIALVIGLTAGLATAAQAAPSEPSEPPPIEEESNACTYTSGGSSRTYCGPCSNETDGVTATPTNIPECSHG